MTADNQTHQQKLRMYKYNVNSIITWMCAQQHTFWLHCVTSSSDF